jgi:RNA polymerase sigma-70 factor (ECF subfamily)
LSDTGDDPDERRWAGWMEAAQAGDRAAYEALLGELASVARRFLLRRLGAVDFVEDVVQEVLLSVHRGRHTWDPRRPFRAWFFAIVRHRCIDQLRRRRAATPEGERVPVETLAQDGDADAMGRDPLADGVDAANLLARLAAPQRRVLELTVFQGLPAAEAGRRLGLSAVAVRVRRHRALARLRGWLEADVRAGVRGDRPGDGADGHGAALAGGELDAGDDGPRTGGSRAAAREDEREEPGP